MDAIKQDLPSVNGSEVPVANPTNIALPVDPDPTPQKPVSVKKQRPIRPSRHQTMGRRKLQRYDNDHHLWDGKKLDLEDIMENMTLNVTWTSTFEKLAREENKGLEAAFREGSDLSAFKSQNNPPLEKMQPTAEDRFQCLPKRLRALIVRIFPTFAPFLGALESILTYFMEWKEVPSRVEIPKPMRKLLVDTLYLTETSTLVIPLKDSSFHRLLLHAMCSFYGLRSWTRHGQNNELPVIHVSSDHNKKSPQIDSKLSFCAFVHQYRLTQDKQQLCGKWAYRCGDIAAELSSNPDEDSDGFEVLSFDDGF